MKTDPMLIFEHHPVYIDGKKFRKEHWEALARYNTDNDGRFFTLLPDGVKFNQFVGVIQVGNLTIEILPKIGSKAVTRNEKKKWQSVLIDMLRECRWMNLYHSEKASLRFKPNSILEAYLEIFLKECEDLVRVGLIKKYHPRIDNLPVLKGKLLVNLQFTKNIVHKERFYSSFSTYDRDNIYNKILLKTLKLIPSLSQSPYLKDKVQTLILSFPELEDIKVSGLTFQRLHYDRKSASYREAMQIAAMLLLNYRPDITSGNNNILALLFDMNDLWEEYITNQIRKFLLPSWNIEVQRQKTFWQQDKTNRYKLIIPDIVIKNDKKVALVIDTKWKIPQDNIPADPDLKQMYVYNEYWEGINSILLYPRLKYSEEVLYHGGYFLNGDGKKCGVAKISVLDQRSEKLYPYLGKKIVKFAKIIFQENEALKKAKTIL